MGFHESPVPTKGPAFSTVAFYQAGQSKSDSWKVGNALETGVAPNLINGVTQALNFVNVSASGIVSQNANIGCVFQRNCGLAKKRAEQRR